MNKEKKWGQSQFFRRFDCVGHSAKKSDSDPIFFGLIALAKKLTLTPFFCCGLIATAQAGAIEQLQQFAKEVKSATGEFVQSQAGRNGKREVWQGSFAFMRPGKFRWVYSQPYEQVLVADGERLYLFDKDLNQVTVRQLDTAIGSSPAAILFGGTALEKHYTLVEEGVENGLEWLAATPKASDSQFEKIRIGWRQGLPENLELRDALGKSTFLQLRKIQRNAATDANLFRFLPSRDAPGADVIHSISSSKGH